MRQINRRHLLGLAALLPLAAVVGCATGPTASTVDEGVRRLMLLSTQRAFARLLAPSGFYQTEIARIAVPEALGGHGKWLNLLLQSSLVRHQIAERLNRIAEAAAARASQRILDAIHRMPLRDAVAVLRGGPTAATTLLQQQVGGAVLDILVPEIAHALQSDIAQLAAGLVAEKTGVNYAELGQAIAGQAADGIFRTIGQEEAAIRADPRATQDPVLIALLEVRR